MAHARIRYLFNREPEPSQAAVGLLLVKTLMVVPHLVIIGALQNLAYTAGYVGYFVVAFTGRVPSIVQDAAAWYMRAWTRTVGFYTGVTDVYPPFETDPDGYLPDLDVPHNVDPSRRWAVAGIFGIKFVAAIPHLLIVAVLNLAVILASWVGFLIVVVRGSLPLPLQDFFMGTTQWTARITAWILGLTDRYPPFDLLVHPLDHDGG